VSFGEVLLWFGPESVSRFVSKIQVQNIFQEQKGDKYLLGVENADFYNPHNFSLVINFNMTNL